MAEAAGREVEPAKLSLDGWYRGYCPGGGVAPCLKPDSLVISKFACLTCHRVLCKDTCAYYVKILVDGQVVNDPGKRYCHGCRVGLSLAIEDKKEHEQKKLQLTWSAAAAGSTKAKKSKANNAAMQSRASAIAEADEKDRAKADELDAELVDHAQKVNSLPELCSDPCGH